jgi:hypothetical protein
MTQLFRVLYCSRSRIAKPEAAADIANILAVSRVNNAREELTGGLLFSDGCFAQVLEGPLAAVERAFERIQCDQRHSDVTVLQAGQIAERDFPNWSMAFAGTADAGVALEGLSLAQAFSGQSSAGNELLSLLRSVVVRETEWLAPVECGADL